MSLEDEEIATPLPFPFISPAPFPCCRGGSVTVTNLEQSGSEFCRHPCPHFEAIYSFHSRHIVLRLAMALHTATLDFALT